MVRVMLLGIACLWLQPPHANSRPFLDKEGSNVVWCLGDSITVGTVDKANPTDAHTGKPLAQNSYRYWLQKLMREHGYKYDFVGRFKLASSDAKFKYADDWWDSDGDGWSGKAATGPAGVLEMLTPRKGEPALIRVPEKTNIVLIHLGSNDLNNRAPAQTPSAEQLRDAIGEIIDRIRDQKPDVKIAVAQIIPWGSGKRNEAFNALVPQLVREKTTERSPVICVDQASGFSAVGDTPDTFDQIHPNDQGEQKMARRWFEALTRDLGPANEEK